MVKPGLAQFSVSFGHFNFLIFYSCFGALQSHKSDLLRMQRQLVSIRMIGSVEITHNHLPLYSGPGWLETCCQVTFPPSTPAWTTFCSDERAGAKMMLTLLLPCSKNPQWLPRGSSITSKFIALHSSAQPIFSNTATVSAQQIPAKVY